MKRMLIVGAVWPEPGSSAAGSRMLQLLAPFRSAGWELTYASTSKTKEFSVDLESLDIRSVAVRVNDPAFDTMLQELRPNVVVFDRFFVEEQFGWRVEEHCPDALRVLDGEDLHCLREARERAFDRGDGYRDEDLRSSLARREVASILRSDLTWVISEYEMALLKGFFKVDSDLLHYVPFLVDPPGALQQRDLPDFDTRQGFLAIGNFRHPPNRDAVGWLKEEIWPLIRAALPDAVLKVAGAYASPRDQALEDLSSGFQVLGRIKDVDTAMQEARVSLAPLRFGAGLKGKLIDAMRNGTPSVTTPIGAEGMSGGLRWAGRIEEDASSIAKAAVSLYQTQSDWEVARDRGFEILTDSFDRDRHESALFESVEVGCRQLAERRERNFLGAMLRDHHHRSTRYLSLWIEAKNRLGEGK